MPTRSGRRQPRCIHCRTLVRGGSITCSECGRHSCCVVTDTPEDYICASCAGEEEAVMPAKSGRHYTQPEINLIYVMRSTPENKELLAEHLGRSPGAIDFAMRWRDDPDTFPPHARNRIRRQMLEARRQLGKQSACSMDFVEWLEARRKAS